MKFIYKAFSLTFLLLNLAACNDDFLERLPQTEIGTENFFNTEEDLSIYVNNFYNFPGFEQYNGDAVTDNAATTGNTELKSMMQGSPSSATISSGWDWDELRSINLFLENYRKADLSEEVLNHYQGVARFFRARFYMEKVMRYSDVPWYSQAISTDDEDLLYKERDPRAMVVDSIFADYQFAAEHMMDGQPVGAVNEWVVKSFLARHALYEGTFRKYHPELNLQGTAETYLTLARDMAKDIMDNGGFAIYSTGSPVSDYQALFNSENLTGNSEVILPRIYENNVLNSGWTATIFGNYEVSPSRDLLQSYLMTDGTYYTATPNYQTKQFVEEFQNRDPRLSQTYAYPGFELIYTSTYSQGGGTYVQQLQKNFTGYHQIKGFLNYIDDVPKYSTDFPVVRYAEILLIYAEAQAELGQLAQADLDMTINTIRDRVGMPHLKMNPAVDPVQSARFPDVQGATPQWRELLEIRRERRIELALEGYRFQDLMRWHAGKLIETEIEGLYFPDLGKYDLTGDDVEDIFLIDNSESIPDGDNKESNALGEKFIYYRVGSLGEDASVYLKNGNSGTVQTLSDRGTFIEPKYYYRPIPSGDVTVNPNLTQIFGWE